MMFMRMTASNAHGAPLIITIEQALIDAVDSNNSTFRRVVYQRLRDLGIGPAQILTKLRTVRPNVTPEQWADMQQLPSRN